MLYLEEFRDAIYEAQNIGEDLHSEVEDAVEEAEGTYESIDKVLTILARLDENLFYMADSSYEEVNATLTRIRDAAEERQSELEDRKYYISSALENLEEAADNLSYI